MEFSPNNKSWIIWWRVMKSKKWSICTGDTNNLVCWENGKGAPLSWSTVCFLAALNRLRVRQGIRFSSLRKVTLSAVIDNISPTSGVAWVSITVTFCQSILSASSTLSSLSLPLDNLRFRMGRSFYHKLPDWLDATSSRIAPTACLALRRWRRRVLQFLSSHIAYLKDTRVGWYPFFLRIRSVSSEMKGRCVLLLRGMT